MKKIAVIGSGISGNAAAWALSKQHEVTLFEKASRAGGHSNTVDIEHRGQHLAVDTGFIVYNDHNYPLLTALFEHLNVSTEQSNMSFGVSLDDGRMEWSGQGLKAVFAQRRNLFSPGFLSMLREIFRFNQICKQDLQAGKLCGTSFDEYLNSRNFSKRLKHDYLVPMTAAIWSTPPQRMLEFPAESLIRFMDNHRLIHKKAERPKWRTVSGGSREYVKRLLADFDGELRLGCGVEQVFPGDNSARIVLEDGQMLEFDEVVLAVHSDLASRMLPSFMRRQKGILDAVAYKPNTVYLHRDTALMPKRRAAWSAWNYMGSRNETGSRDISVTYWMNRLQNLQCDFPVLVSLNPERLPEPDKIFRVFNYDHPQFDGEAMKAQQALPTIQGEGNIHYCGAWTRYGFHEDGLHSGLNVARSLGARIPWEENTAEANNATGTFLQAAE